MDVSRVLATSSCLRLGDDLFLLRLLWRVEATANGEVVGREAVDLLDALLAVEGEVDLKRGRPPQTEPKIIYQNPQEVTFLYGPGAK